MTIIRIQVGILIFNPILKKATEKCFSDSIRPVFFSQSMDRNSKIKQTYIYIDANFIAWYFLELDSGSHYDR